MRKWLIGCGIVLLLLLTVVLWLQSGPRAPVPTTDPIVRWNAEHAQLADNAADLYRAAFAKLVGDEKSAWWTDFRKVTDPVPPEAVAWVEQNHDALELARQATELPHCWFVVESTPDGNYLLPHLGQLRTLARLLRWRVFIAAEQHDATTLADSAIEIDRFARHVDDGIPCVINALVGMAIRALAIDGVTRPLLWEEMSDADRRAYLARLMPIFDPPPALADVLVGEQELLVWMYLSAAPPSLERTLIASPERAAGELERYFRPLRELAAEPIERQCDPSDPLALRIQAIENERPSKFNVPRRVASILIPSLTHALSIRARLISAQRGTRTVLELYACRDRTGDFPDTLKALGGEFSTDPFSGGPFIYGRADDGFTLYSVGIDRKDNGGRHNPRVGENRTNRDFVFWPIPDREPTSQPTTKP